MKIETIDPVLSEEAESKLKALLKIELARFKHPHLERFLAHVPKARTSDLITCFSDHTTLGSWIGAGDVATEDQAKYLIYAAVLAIKYEIDRRFPAPKTEEK